MRNGKKMRRTIFIKRGFQMRFIIWVIALLILCGICSAAVLYPFLSSEISSELSTGHRDAEDIKRHLALAIIIGNVLAVIVAALATTVVILYISHKIAGPLYRFEMICKEVGRGNLNVYAGLREKDQLGGLSEAFSEMLAQLRSRCSDQYTRLETARKNLSELKNALSDPVMSKKLVGTVDGTLALLAEEMKKS
ncbi:MAG: HAMP domain-containing protein [Planctomycetes bacterium]|nr:HAMP domain-containing protein [Planctomycetota bacterium]